MIGRITTFITVLRDIQTEDNGLAGDDIDNDNETVAASGVPASFAPDGQSDKRRSTTTPQTIQRFVCRVPSTTDVRPDDRIRDSAGVYYAVDAINQRPKVGYDTGIKLNLHTLA